MPRNAAQIWRSLNSRFTLMGKVSQAWVETHRVVGLKFSLSVAASGPR